MKCDIVYSENEGVYTIKKLTTLIITLLIACLPLTFFGCDFGNETSEQQTDTSTQQIEYDRIELTKENYDEYLYISSTISDCLYDVVEVHESTGTRYYNLSCIINLEIRPARQEYRFEGLSSGKFSGNFVAIQFGFDKSMLWSNNGGGCHIDYYGYAKHSIPTSREYHSKLDFPELSNATVLMTWQTVHISNIYGYVLIPKNFEA